MRYVGEADELRTMAVSMFSRLISPSQCLLGLGFIEGRRPSFGRGKMEQGRHGIFAHIDRLGSPRGTFFPASSLDLRKGTLVECTYSHGRASRGVPRCPPHSFCPAGPWERKSRTHDCGG